MGDEFVIKIFVVLDLDSYVLSILQYIVANEGD